MRDKGRLVIPYTALKDQISTLTRERDEARAMVAELAAIMRATKDAIVYHSQYDGHDLDGLLAKAEALHA